MKYALLFLFYECRHFANAQSESVFNRLGLTQGRPLTSMPPCLEEGGGEAVATAWGVKVSAITRCLFQKSWKGIQLTWCL